jgi:hypothetical protein
MPTPTRLLLALLAFATLPARADSQRLDLRARTVVKDELRLVVETSRTYRPLFSGSSRTADAKGYLVLVNLASDKPLDEVAQVYGPLWDVPNPRSSISFEAGANFTQEDADAAAATPMCTFAPDGTLLRFTRDPARKTLVRDALVVSPTAASWKRQGDVKPVDDDLPPMSEARLLSPSGQYILLFQNGQATLSDLFTGQPKDDPWLTNAFAHAHSIKNFKNVRYHLTDDLNHLVLCPMAIWNDKFGPSGKTHETFDLDGKTHTRADVGLAYSRPDPAPKLFPRKMEPGQSFLDEGPRDAFSINGKLYLLMTDEKALRLYTPDGSKEFRLDAHGKPQWPLYPFLQLQHAPANNELIIFDTNEITRTAGPNETVSVIRWNYQTATLTRHNVPVLKLFDRDAAQFKPRAIHPIN